MFGFNIFPEKTTRTKKKKTKKKSHQCTVIAISLQLIRENSQGVMTIFGLHNRRNRNGGVCEGCTVQSVILRAGRGLTRVSR